MIKWRIKEVEVTPEERRGAQRRRRPRDPVASNPVDPMFGLA